MEIELQPAGRLRDESGTSLITPRNAKHRQLCLYSLVIPFVRMRPPVAASSFMMLVRLIGRIKAG
jgi:hypothetical protein